MTRLLYVFFTLLSTQFYAQYIEPFSFKNSLRIDFYLSGDAKNEKVIFSQLKKEPYWGGSKKNLIQPDYGMMRIQLVDIQTNKVVFSKGFTSLFNEWDHHTTQ